MTVTLALPTAVGVAWLVACTVTVASDGTLDGSGIEPRGVDGSKRGVSSRDAVHAPGYRLIRGILHGRHKLLGGIHLDACAPRRYGYQYAGSLACLAGIRRDHQTGNIHKLRSPDPFTFPKLCRSESFQRESGTPERYHADPLSASIMPYFFSARRIT